MKTRRVILAVSKAAGKFINLKHKILVITIVAALFAIVNVPGVVKSLIYYDEVGKQAARYGIDPLMVISIIYAESSFIPHAQSRKGAVGLMQILPSTYAEIGKELGLSDSGSSLKDPRVNIKVGVYYLSKLRREKWIENDIELLSAYNAGRGKALSWKRESGGRITPEKIPYKETRDYVVKVTRTHRWLKKISGK
ncbi:MAG: lytic transglycosylase domain-containing protein [Endomicrobiia bacterium]|nr:lytic transglycosylase domain-containing protein [Endomicrobiia bacterium]